MDGEYGIEDDQPDELNNADDENDEEDSKDKKICAKLPEFKKVTDLIV